MKEEQAISLIRETFEEPFDKGRFMPFVKNILNRMEDAPFTYPSRYIKESFRPYINSMERIGKYSDGKAEMDILIVSLQKETTLERARTAQRNYIASYLNGSRGDKLKDAALVAFVSPSEEDWRFSLVRMDYKYTETPTGKAKIKEEFTPARRWSFLVGANEKSHTAQSRLLPFLIDDEKKPSLDELAEAFNIETVTKEFFINYRNLFIVIKLRLDEIINNDTDIKADFKEKGIDSVNFSKKLLGQIVFLYFLQKKGWFGVPKHGNWGSGSRHFLRELFEKKHGNYRNFFNDILEPLFYEALRMDRSHDDNYYSRFDCKIPFLNGGLFDPIGGYDWSKTEIVLPNELFSNDERTEEGDTGTGILDVFDRFNFTVREDIPLDKEVAIDPELLGKAYEKFNAIRPDNFDDYHKSIGSGKENKFNKEFGVYYTPREIVHYMCQKSLEYYLKEEFKDTVPESDMEDFVAKAETVLENELVYQRKLKQIEAGEIKKTEYAPELKESILAHMKDIDDKLKEIKICDPAVGSGAFPVGLMTEIVRLRSAIHILSSGTMPPLYDIKRNCIEKSIYGVDIDEGAIEIARLRLWLSLVVDEDDIKNIKPLPNLDYKLVRGNSLLGVEKNIHTKPMLDELEEVKKKHFNETNPTKKKEEAAKITELISKITDGHKEFDFEIYFSEVFKKKKGFDVVIGNPPYVQLQKNKGELANLYQNCGYETFSRTGDIYCLFYEKGICLLHNNGVLSFISSNKYQRTGYGKLLRKFIASSTHVKLLIDFGELPVFEAATDPAIVLLTKEHPSPDSPIMTCVIKEVEDIQQIGTVVMKRANARLQSSLQVEGWTLENSSVLSLLAKLRTIGRPLGEHVNGRFYYGIKTGFNEAFIVDRETRDKLIKEDRSSDELLKPFVHGADVKRWRAELRDDWLIFTKRKVDIDRYPAILRHLKQFKKKLMPGAEDGRKPGSYEWYEIQDNIAYYKEFDQPKIVFNETSKELHAFYDEDGFYLNKTLFMLVPPKPKPLLALLLSRTLDWLYRQEFPSWGDPWKDGRIQFRGDRMATVPIPDFSLEIEKSLTAFVDQILSAKRADPQADTSALESQIDLLVYQLYGLTEEEIQIVEGGEII